MAETNIKEPETGISTTEYFIDTSFSTSAMYQSSQWYPYNPDDLVRKFGGNSTGLDKYQKMRQDPTLKAALYTKKAAIISSGWRIEPVSEDSLDVEIAEELSSNLTDWYDGNFDSSLMEIMSAIEFGYSVTEKIYETDGQYIYLKRLKTRPPQTFEFYADEYGNLLPDGIRQWSNKFGQVKLPKEKFILFVHNREFDNFYGDSDLRAAYRSWWSKENLIKFWNIYLERFGMPLMIGRYDKTTSKDERTDLREMLDNLQAKTSFTIPKGVELDIKESAKQAGGDYDNALQMHNNEMRNAILMPKGLGFGDAEGGSYAKAGIEKDVFAWIVEKARRELETVVNSQMIRQMVNFNYPEIENYPKFKFNPVSEEDKNAKADLVIKAIQFGAVSSDVKTENYLRKLLDMPEIDIQPQPEAIEPEAKEFKLRREPRGHEKKIDFKLANKILADDIEIDVEEIKKTLRKIRDDYTSQIVRKKVVDQQIVSDVGKVEFHYIRDFGLQIESYLRNAYEGGYEVAKKAVKKSYAVKNITYIGLVASKASMWIKEQSKILTGKISNDLQQKCRDSLLDGISKGQDTATVVNRIEEEFEKYVATEGNEGSDVTSRKLFTEVNTTYSKAFSVGMEEYFKPLEEEGDIEAYEFSAILDNVTTDGCEELDGQIYGADNPYWNEIDPPRHWNCRSLKLPIFRGEEWTESETLSVTRDF